jgi:hypothetical protein
MNTYPEPQYTIEDITLHYMERFSPIWYCTINGRAGNVAPFCYGEGQTMEEAFINALKDGGIREWSTLAGRFFPKTSEDR